MNASNSIFALVLVGLTLGCAHPQRGHVDDYHRAVFVQRCYSADLGAGAFDWQQDSRGNLTVTNINADGCPEVFTLPGPGHVRVYPAHDSIQQWVTEHDPHYGGDPRKKQ